MAKTKEERNAYSREYYHKNKKTEKYELERDLITGKYYNPKPLIFDIPEIIKLYINDLLSTEKIAKKYNVDKTTIRRILVKNHVKLRGIAEVKKLNSSEKNSKWKGFGEVRGAMLATIKVGAKARKLEFNITAEYIWNLFLKQDRKCIFSGLVLRFASDDVSHKSGGTTASLDRIDSSKGYIEGNVQWVHKKINVMKQAMTDAEFINWCHIISINRRY